MLGDSSQTAEARRLGTAMAQSLGFNETKAGQVAIVVTELATNLLKHAGGGEILLCPETASDGTTAMSILAIDKGPGMTNVAACLEDGYSSAGSAGTGLGAIGRQSQSLEIYSQPGEGTVSWAWITAGAKPREDGMEKGGFSVPVTGETVCGDAWALVGGEAGPTLLVADGLGHGPLAAEASQAAVAALQEKPELAPAEQMERVHTALRHTRGAAVAIAAFDLKRREMRYCGVGNIAGAVGDGSSSQHFVSMAGTVGHHVRTPREFTYSLPPNALPVFHSDGVGTRWNLTKYPGLTMKPPMLIAGVLYRDFGRIRDDATVVVLRARGTC